MVSRTVLVFFIVLLVGPLKPVLSATPKAGESTLPRDTAGDAQTRTKILDGLFAALQQTKDESVADRLVNRIWMTWHTSKHAKINDLVSLGVIYTNEAEYDAALEILNKLVKLAPKFAEGWNRRATLYYLMGDYDRSLADVKTTLALEPRHFGALAGRGQIYNARGEYKKALHAFEQALRLNPFLTERKTIIPALRQKIGEQKI